MSEAARSTIETVWRMESARLIGGLVRVVRDVDLAEELAQEALLAALESWPRTGVPHNPGAWLMTAAKHRAIDELRRRQMLERKHDELGREPAGEGETVAERLIESIDDEVGDDVLRLLFVSCHPVLSPEARAALTLRLVAGLTSDEIARAFLVSGPTMAQRLVRAKRTLAESGVPFEVPRGDELASRLPSVLEVVYLIFNEGYAASGGSNWMRAELCQEALRLARALAARLSGESEVQGLVALLELQASRLRARLDRHGRPVLLADQDRRRWDRTLISRGFAALAEARKRGAPLGPYGLQAAIAACHASAARFEDTDWQGIAALYDALVEITGSPVVALNRAVAVAKADGPAAGLELLDELEDEPVLRRYHLLPAVRAELLTELGRTTEALGELERALELAGNDADRTILRERIERLRSPLH